KRFLSASPELARDLDQAADTQVRFNHNFHEADNVYQIIVDDLNDWLSCLDGHPEYDTTKQEPGRMIPSHQHPGLKVQDWFDKYQ
ncbi:MAG: hypothetical protein AAF492_32930, partial [Verrucomicrobiota bacterium]